MTDKPKYFCIAPWTHTYISPQSERRICCASREQATWTRQYIDQNNPAASKEYKPSTLEEHWNSEHMRSVRRRILNGERIPECEVCHSQQLNLYTYRSYFNDTLFPDRFEQAVASTDKTGATTMQPISFDYRIYNLCNFKCRMCGEQLSSSWETEKRLMNAWDTKREHWMLPDNKKTVQRFQVDVVEQELWDAVKERKVEEIYWVGGEPLMYSCHWDIMKYLVESGHSKNVVVRYNTNLSQVERNGVRLYDLLPHFKRVNMCCSQDATHEVAEYIRTGLNYNLWLQNFKDGLFLIDQFGPDAMVIDVTITLPGLLDMKNVMQLAVDLGVKSYVKVTFDFDSSAVMSPMALPRSLLDPILQDLLEFEQDLGSPLTSVYRETFENMLARPTFEEKYPDTFEKGLTLGKQRMLDIAKFRKDGQAGHSVEIDYIFETQPKVLAWWKKL